jgi:hypothetical protein
MKFTTAFFAFADFGVTTARFITTTPPAPTPAAVFNKRDGFAESPAVPATTQVTTHVAPDPGPELFTIEYRNHAEVDLTTIHVQGGGATGRAPNGGLPAPGNMNNGATHSVLYPTGWEGNVRFNKAGKSLTEDDTLIESSYKVQSPDPDAGLAINWSYVHGYTYPGVCNCAATGAHLTGCDKKLWALNTCPNINSQGACVNPRREITDKEPTPFFAPCQGLAYTFPTDIGSLSNSRCQSGHIICEILPDDH